MIGGSDSRKEKARMLWYACISCATLITTQITILHLFIGRVMSAKHERHGMGMKTASYRAKELDNMCLYDWIRRCKRNKIQKSKETENPLGHDLADDAVCDSVQDLGPADITASEIDQETFDRSTDFRSDTVSDVGNFR